MPSFTRIFFPLILPCLQSYGCYLPLPSQPLFLPVFTLTVTACFHRQNSPPITLFQLAMTGIVCNCFHRHSSWILAFITTGSLIPGKKKNLSAFKGSIPACYHKHKSNLHSQTHSLELQLLSAFASTVSTCFRTCSVGLTRAQLLPSVTSTLLPSFRSTNPACLRITGLVCLHNADNIYRHKHRSYANSQTQVLSAFINTVPNCLLKHRSSLPSSSTPHAYLHKKGY